MILTLKIYNEKCGENIQCTYTIMALSPDYFILKTVYVMNVNLIVSRYNFINIFNVNKTDFQTYQDM